MKKRIQPLSPDAPLQLEGHGRPLTRRDFIARGLLKGAALIGAPTVFSLFAAPRAAYGALSGDIATLRDACGIRVAGAGKIPFICFDLAGGANIAGSNVLVGGQGGQFDFLPTAGYAKLGLPGNMIPGLAEATPAAGGNGDHTDSRLGLGFHTDSSFLRGIVERAATGTLNGVNGAIIPARSENDTGNNPHNPLYGIFRAGADGELLSLIGSVNSESGGNSTYPMSLFNASARPVKIDRPSDVTGLVDTGKLVGLLSQQDAVAVMESIVRISDRKLGNVSTAVTADAVIKDLVRCGYVKSADLADRFGNPTALNPLIDTNIVGGGGGLTPIFTAAEIAADGEFAKTASVMKLVVNGYAGAGCITMGGFDYHTGDRSTGEARDLRAGRCIGACLEYAARVGVPLMIYVFSDGGVFSNGMLDTTVAGRGKGVWTGDDQQTAATFFLVYNPGGRAQLLGGTPLEQARHQQLGWFRSSGDVETSATPAANNVNLLVETIALNYMALHNEQGLFASRFPGSGLGSAAMIDRLTAFAPVCNGTIA
ncbi:MAG: hypothetical protein ACOY33_11750 [Pseudomonadota bacterium]